MARPQPEALGGSFSVWQLEQLFDQCIIKSNWAPRSRKQYYADWRSFVTFAYGHGELEDVYPASWTLVKAFIGFLFVLNYSAQSIITKVAAVTHRHTSRNLPSPCPPRSIAMTEKALGR